MLLGDGPERKSNGSEARATDPAAGLTLAALADQKIWVGWRSEQRNGKPTKIPYSPRSGAHASSTDDATWGKRDEAERWAKQRGADGVGVVLGTIKDAHLWGIDLDSCRDPATGAIDAWAQEIIARIDTYAEISPSKRGVKLFALMRPADLETAKQLMGSQGRKFANGGGGEHGPAIEIYVSGRYFTVTNDAIGDIAMLRQVDLRDLEWLLQQGARFAGGQQRSNTDDNSRSAKAWRRACELKGKGYSYEAMRDALLADADPSIAEWAREKGLQLRERNLRRIYERAPARKRDEEEKGSGYSPRVANLPPALNELGEACGTIQSASLEEWETTVAEECPAIGGLISSGALDDGLARACLYEAADRPSLEFSAIADSVDRALARGKERPRWPATPAARSSFDPTPFVHRDPSTLPPREFLYGHHYIRKYVSATVAPTGVGKSSLIIVEALAMTAFRNLLGVTPEGALRVWYWNGEDPREELERRVLAACLKFKIDHNAIAGRLFIDSGREAEIIVAQQNKNGAVIAAPVADALINALRRCRIDVLILDPLVSAHRVSENDNMAIDAVVKTLGTIASAANCAVELVHHVRKTGGAEITPEDARGAVALIAAARSVRVLNPMSKDEAKLAGVGDKRRFYFRSDIGKANLAPPPSAATWHYLDNVGLNNGSSDDDQDWVGVVTPWRWPDAFAGVGAGGLAVVKAAIADGQWRRDSRSPDWVGVAVAMALGLNVEDEAHKGRIKDMLKTWIASGALVVIWREDKSRQEREFVEVGDWPEEEPF